jgi:hypothetical protein
MDSALRGGYPLSGTVWGVSADGSLQGQTGDDVSKLDGNDG